MTLLHIDDTRAFSAEKQSAPVCQGAVLGQYGDVNNLGPETSAVPLLHLLMRTSGNSSKLDAANLLLQAIAPVFASQQSIFTLIDSWYMKWPYLSSALNLGFQTIGQVHRDTALYDMPVNTAGRGRPELMVCFFLQKIEGLQIIFAN